MAEGRGTHFDPRVLDAFLASREAVAQVYAELVEVDCQDAGQNPAQASRLRCKARLCKASSGRFDDRLKQTPSDFLGDDSYAT